MTSQLLAGESFGGELVKVLTAFKEGDFSVRMPAGHTGMAGKAADALNDILGLNERMAKEFERINRTVGKEGKIAPRASLGSVAGSWTSCIDSVNGLIGDLVQTLTEVARVIGAVAKGDLTQGMALEVNGRPLEGEFLRTARVVNTMVNQLNSFASEVTRVAREVGVEGKLGGQAVVDGVAGTWKDLTDSVNSMAGNLNNQVRNIAAVTTAVAKGDLSQKITVDVRGEILELKNTINTMVDQLNAFASEVTRVAREVGTEGKLGGQAAVKGVAGTWKDLTDSVNSMASNLTNQVRNIAEVTTAVANGDLSRKITVDVQGEILELKNTINTMVDQLNSFASEVTRVAREVGVEGKLGGQARVPGAAGIWKDLTTNLNQLAATLTGQVRAIAEVATAVTNGDLSRSISVEAQGEVAALKDNINEMIRNLRETTRKLKELDELKSRFFTNISHELRTPLALVLGPVERLLAQGGLTAKQRIDLEVVEHNGRTLLKHVNDLLNIARLDEGKMAVEYAPCNLARLVALTAAHFEALARERSIAFSVEIPPSAPAQADTDKLQRVMLNLLSNAFKFTPDRGAIRCQLRSEQQWATITVQDNGPGVPEAMREAIFERFRQGQGGALRGGTGLGLAIAKEFVDLHRGTIAVCGAPGGGALFRVELPLQAPPGVPVLTTPPQPAKLNAAARLTAQELRPASGVESDSLPEDPETAGRPLVLVVEDNPEMNRFVTESLAPEYRTAAASDGEEGLQKALLLHPDLILSDVMMPGLSGDELVQRLRGYPEVQTIPIVLLTAKADAELRTSLLRSGAQDYLTKPFSVEEMRARIANLISMKRARETLQKELETQNQNLEELAQELAAQKREEQAARADAEAANRVKDEFLATVSHELRTPLTAVLGWSRLLRKGNLDPETTNRGLEAIENNAKAQAQLIGDILDISRIVAGKVRLDLQPLELGAVIEAATNAVRPEAEAKGIRLTTLLDPPTDPVNGDPGRLQQVVWNLLSNAIKFTPNGGQVQIQLARVKSHAELSITDTGEGISPEFLPHVFEPFRQAEGSTTRAHSGLGLGLAIVRHLVELHGGSVHADSPGEGRGATFTVKLPLLGVRARKGKDVHPKADSGDSLEVGAALDGLKVLVVDDQADTREMLSAALGRYGAKIISVASAPEAIEELVRSRPDVLLCDIAMPGEDGYTLLRRVRSLDAEKGGRVPAAAVTAYAGAEDRARILRAGFQRYVPKPVDPVELAAIVAALAGRSVEA